MSEAVETYEHADLTVKILADTDNLATDPRDRDCLLGYLGWNEHAGLASEKFGERSIAIPEDLDQLYEVCDRCEGSGTGLIPEDGGAWANCGACDGTGEVRTTLARYLREEYDAIAILPIRYADFGSSGQEVSEVEDHRLADANGVLFTTAERCAELGVPNALALDQLRGELRELDLWTQGECYGFVIENKAGEHLDSCWGFIAEYEPYGKWDPPKHTSEWAYLKLEAESAAEACAEAIERENQERAYWAARDVQTIGG